VNASRFPVSAFWIAIVLVATFAGCDLNGKRGGDAASRWNECPAVVDVASRSGLSNRGRVRGDVDGDGRLDDVSLLADPRARPKCRYYLVVRSATIYGTPLTVSRGNEAFGAPVLSALVDIGPARGAEIVVVMHRGATTDAVSLFQANGEDVGELKVTGSSASILAAGTSGAGVAVADCRGQHGNGEVVASVAVREGDRFEIERRIFHLDRNRLMFVRQEQETSKKLAAPEFKTRSFGDLLFRSCTVARATYRS
jgi:hypothetical protein